MAAYAIVPVGYSCPAGMKKIDDRSD